MLWPRVLVPAGGTRTASAVGSWKTQQLRLVFYLAKTKLKQRPNGTVRSADGKREYVILFFFRGIYDDNQEVKPLNSIIKRKASSFSPLAFKVPQKAEKNPLKWETYQSTLK